MVEKGVFLTKEGLSKLEAELDNLRTARRQEVAEKIQRAKELGGTENNAEYENAKEEQFWVEGRIIELEDMIRNVTLITGEKSANHEIRVGSRVMVQTQDGKKESYTLVDIMEASPSDGKISYKSPVGRALMGKKKGEKVEVAVPAGTLKFKILEVK